MTTDDGPLTMDSARRRRARVKTYAGQPIAPIVERLRYGVRRPGAALQSTGADMESS